MGVLQLVKPRLNARKQVASKIGTCFKNSHKFQRGLKSAEVGLIETGKFLACYQLTKDPLISMTLGKAIGDLFETLTRMHFAFCSKSEKMLFGNPLNTITQLGTMLLARAITKGIPETTTLSNWNEIAKEMWKSPYSKK